MFSVEKQTIRPESELQMEIRTFEEDESTCIDTCGIFRSRLPVIVQLSGQWKVSLTEVTIAATNYTFSGQNSDLYIYASIVERSIVGGSMKRLLRRVNFGTNIDSFSRNFYNVKFVDNHHYRNVSTSSLTNIGFTISTPLGEVVRFPPRTSVSLSLHFKQLP